MAKKEQVIHLLLFSYQKGPGMEVKGLCIECKTEPRVAGHRFCQGCFDTQRTKKREEKRLEYERYYRVSRAAKACVTCKVANKLPGRVVCQACLDVSLRAWEES